MSLSILFPYVAQDSKQFKTKHYILINNFKRMH